MNAEHPLRPYQIPAKKKIVEKRRVPLIAPMGSGKTRVALEAWAEVSDETRCAAVYCPLNSTLAWVKQIQQWLGIPREQIGVAQGDVKQREATWRQLGKKYRFVITTYASFYRDVDRGFIPKDLDTFLDEPHRVMRKRTKTWEKLCTWTRHSRVVIPVDGTPIRKGPQDLFTYLKLCYPRNRAFSSYWRYVKTWCDVEEGYFGKEIVGAKNVANFKREVLGKYCAFVPKSSVAEYLPEKHRLLIPIEPTAEQRKILDKIEKEMLVSQEGGKLLITPNTMTQILRQRQILCCPKILNQEWGYGACIEAIIERLEDLDTPRPVIFTPFADAIPHLQSAVQKAYRNRKIWTLRGGTKLADLQRITDGFNNSEDDIMICTVQFAESFEFPKSQWAFFCGFDWSWDVNEQAEDRLRRLTSIYPNSFYGYFVHEGTIDGRVLEVLNDAHRNVSRVTPANLHEILGGVENVRL